MPNSRAELNEENINHPYATKPRKEPVKSLTRRLREWRLKRRPLNNYPPSCLVPTNSTTSPSECSTVLSTSRDAECHAAPAPRRVPEPFTDTDAVKSESGIVKYNDDATLCSGVKQEFIALELTVLDGQKSAQATWTPAGAGSVTVDQDVCIKEEPGDTDLDIAPNVLQPMDPCCRINQQNTSVVETETVIDNDSHDTIPSHIVMKKSVQDKCAGAEPNVYICDYCQKMFNYKYRIIDHITSAHASASAASKCNKCGKIYRCKRYLKKHMTNIHNSIMTKCNVCDKLMRPCYLKEHERNVHRDKKSQCDTCRVIMTSEQCLHNHMNDQQSAGVDGAQATSVPVGAGSAKPGIHIAVEGSYLVIVPAVLQRNPKENTSVVGTENTIAYESSDASLCSSVKEGVSRSVTGSVTDKGVESYNCNQCAKSFIWEPDLKTHKANVHPADTKKCNVCGMSLKPGGISLKDHMQHWHNEEQVQCVVCGKKIKSKYFLCQHINEHHGLPSTIRKPDIYICDYCLRTFTSKPCIVWHIVSKHSRRFYECNQCAEFFICESDRRTHKTDVHPADMKKCNVCGISLKTGGISLKDHMQHWHSEEQVQCVVCGEKIKSKYFFCRHMNEHRGQPFAKSNQQSACGKIGEEIGGTHPTGGEPSTVANVYTQQQDVVVMKEEPADEELELGPVMFQHMDRNFRPYKEEPLLE